MGSKLSQALRAALAGIEGGRLDRADDLLRTAWRMAPYPQIAAALEVLVAELPSALVAEDGMAPSFDSSDEADLAWHNAAADAGPRDRLLLLRAAADGNSRQGATRLHAAEGWVGGDPRLQRALVELAEAIPFRARSTKQFWVEVFARGAEIDDATVRARLLATATLFRRDIHAVMAQWMVQRLDLVMARAPPPRTPAPPDAETAPLLDKLSELTAKLAARARQRETQADPDALLAAIYQAPSDDSARRVYADYLVERGDPRGELIHLQLRSHQLGRDERRREKQLLARHGKDWLGPLAKVVLAKGLRYERGFVAACVVSSRSERDLAAVAGDPRWSTVVELLGTPTEAIACDETLRALRTLEADCALVDAFERRARATAIETLQLHLPVPHNAQALFDNPHVDTPAVAAVFDEADLAPLRTLHSMPRLQRLILLPAESTALVAQYLRPADYGWIFEIPQARQLELLELEIRLEYAGELLAYVAAQRFPIRVVRTPSEQLLRFEATFGEDRRAQVILPLRADEGTAYWARHFGRLLTSLAKGPVDRVTVTLAGKKRLARDARAELERVAATLDDVEVVLPV